MMATARKLSDRDVADDVLRDAPNKGRSENIDINVAKSSIHTRQESIHENVDKLSINVTTSSKGDHPKTVHENVESSKCLGKTNENEKAVGFSVHENVKQSEKVQIKAQIQDSNKHKITVHEKVKIPKCSVEVEVEMKNSIEHKNTVHEKVKIPKCNIYF